MTIVKILSKKYPYIEVEFSNGVVTSLDIGILLKNINKAMFKKIMDDPHNFDTVILESGTLTWFGVGFDPDEIWEYYETHKPHKQHPAASNLVSQKLKKTP